MRKILAINGSYRSGGITDQALQAFSRQLESRGVTTEIVLLREHAIGFCHNCRECALLPGESPGRCVQQDDMEQLVDRIEQADGFIIASPTNFGTVTALYKRFMERLAVYAYWPWGQPAPKYRKAGGSGKKAILVSSCAAPGFLGRWVYNTRGQLKTTAKVIGAQPVGTMFTGLVATEPEKRLSPAALKKINRLAVKLL